MDPHACLTGMLHCISQRLCRLARGGMSVTAKHVCTLLVQIPLLTLRPLYLLAQLLAVLRCNLDQTLPPLDLDQLLLHRLHEQGA